MRELFKLRTSKAADGSWQVSVPAGVPSQVEAIGM